MSDIEYDAFDTESTELSRDERHLLEVNKTLDAAGAPRTDTERDGAGLNIELNPLGRVRWLVDDRDDMKRKFADLSAELNECAKERNDHAAHLSELHTKLRQMFDAESVAEALDWAAVLKTQRNAFMRQRDEAIAKVSAAVDDAAELATENLLQERTIAKLTMKIEQLEVRKFAITTDLVRVQQKADVVVDLVSGSVVKNRFGKAVTAPTSSTKARRPSAKPKPRKR